MSIFNGVWEWVHLGWDGYWEFGWMRGCAGEWNKRLGFCKNKDLSIDEETSKEWIIMQGHGSSGLFQCT